MRQEITDRLSELADDTALRPEFRSAVSYYLLPPGKLVRPLFALQLCHDLGGSWRLLVDGAVAVELVHAATLIHDDLPAMDNDDFRRGRPSCHRAHGEAAALLAGDFLVGKAFSLVCSSDLSDELPLQLVSELSQAFMQVCEGQDLDMRHVEAAELERLHSLKTGALFGASAAFGAIAAGANSAIVSAARAFGVSLGVCFQIVDDFVDAFGSGAARGRPEASDVRNSKLTFFTGVTEEKGRVALRTAQDRMHQCLHALVRVSGRTEHELAATVRLTSELTARM